MTPTTNNVMQDRPLNRAERDLALWLKHRDALGSFHRSLFDAISTADEDNMKRLGAGFPEHVIAWGEYWFADLQDRLKAAGLL